jgi:serine/threonine protein phosphatase PrpC
MSVEHGFSPEHNKEHAEFRSVECRVFTLEKAKTPSDPRSGNDVVFGSARDGVLAVADGCSGSSREAAEYAVHTVVDAFIDRTNKPDDFEGKLYSRLAGAVVAIPKKLQDNKINTETTLAAVVCGIEKRTHADADKDASVSTEPTACVVHVGDTRVYKFDIETEELHVLTGDHLRIYTILLEENERKKLFELLSGRRLGFDSSLAPIRRLLSDFFPNRQERNAYIDKMQQKIEEVISEIEKKGDDPTKSLQTFFSDEAAKVDSLSALRSSQSENEMAVGLLVYMWFQMRHTLNENIGSRSGGVGYEIQKVPIPKKGCLFVIGTDGMSDANITDSEIEAVCRRYKTAPEDIPQKLLELVESKAGTYFYKPDDVGIGVLEAMPK